MEHRWYAIQTTSGHENKVRNLLQRRIDGDPRLPEDRSIRQALVPTQEVVEIKNGKKVNVERKIYPGYVLVEMMMDQETAHTVNGIQGVIKFVGHERLPQPLRAEEVNRLLGIADDAATEEPKERDSVPCWSGCCDHRGSVHGLQRDGRGSHCRQGQGPRVGVAVWSANVGRARLPAAQGILGVRFDADKRSGPWPLFLYHANPWLSSVSASSSAITSRSLGCAASFTE